MTPPCRFSAPTSSALADASELAVLVVLTSALEMAIEALYATHPELAGGEAFLDGPTPELWVADGIVNQAAALKASVATYRHAVDLRHADAARRCDPDFAGDW